MIRIAIPVILGICGLVGCGPSFPSVTAASTQCKTQQAQIRIGDGMIQNLCGCQEPAGGPVKVPTSFTCTVHQGTTVFFFFVGDTLKHELVPNSGSANALPASALYDPLKINTPRAHAATLTTLGTYAFHDDFMPGLTAQMIVIP